MLSVIWSSHEEWYATDASSVLEVVPLIVARAIVGMPEWFVGLGDHHGRLVPIVDADRLLGREPADATLATRILLVETTIDRSARIVGLKVDAVRGIEDVDFADRNGHAGLRSPEMPHLGEIVSHRDHSVQRLHLGRWFEGERGDLLFGRLNSEIDPHADRGGAGGDSP